MTINQATIDFIRQHQDEDVRQLAFLGSKYPEVNMPFALDQIRGRKMAHVKLPRWASIEGIIYPPHISMEQCSSEQTALYKAELAARLLGLSVSSSENEKECEKDSNSHFSKICEFASEGAVDSEFAKNEDTCKKQQILTECDKYVNKSEGEPNEEDFSEEIEFVDLTGGFGVDFSYIASRLGVKSVYVERQHNLQPKVFLLFESMQSLLYHYNAMISEIDIQYFLYHLNISLKVLHLLHFV